MVDDDEVEEAENIEDGDCVDVEVLVGVRRVENVATAVTDDVHDDDDDGSLEVVGIGLVPSCNVESEETVAVTEVVPVNVLCGLDVTVEDDEGESGPETVAVPVVDDV